MRRLKHWSHNIKLNFRLAKTLILIPYYRNCPRLDFSLELLGKKIERRKEFKYLSVTYLLTRDNMEATFERNDSMCKQSQTGLEDSERETGDLS